MSVFVILWCMIDEKSDNVKYIVMLGDGMADNPIAVLNKKTPLEAANKPIMDHLASHGINGTVDTVPEGMVPESDTANLSVMGYDPKTYLTGRSPLEAASIGIFTSAGPAIRRA